MRHWYLVHRVGKRLSPVANVFREFLLDGDAAALLKSPVGHPVAKAAGVPEVAE
jgi:hypothetical protein